MDDTGRVSFTEPPTLLFSLQTHRFVYGSLRGTHVRQQGLRLSSLALSLQTKDEVLSDTLLFLISRLRFLASAVTDVSVSNGVQVALPTASARLRVLRETKSRPLTDSRFGSGETAGQPGSRETAGQPGSGLIQGVSRGIW